MAARVAMLLENNPYPQDVRVRHEAEALAAAGWEVAVIAPRAAGQPRREVCEGGVSVRRFRLPPERHSVAAFLAEYAVAAVKLHALGALELMRGARVLHFHNPPDFLFPLGFVARALRRRVVFDHHDLTPEMFAMKFGDSPALGVLRAFERLTFRCASLVIATNESHRGVARGRGRVAPHRVVVVRNGPRAALLEASRPARGGDLADPQLVFVGELEPQDGVVALPELMRLLRDDHDLPGARLTVVGSGTSRVEVESELARLGLSESVEFTGRVPHQRIPGLLAAADLCVDPAPCTELNHSSTMVKIAEYLAAGRPVVANRLRETEDTAGEAALYAECGDRAGLAAAAARLAREPALRAELAETGRRQAAGLTWERSEQVLVKAYAGLANGKAAA